jgi:hypothetical protein
LSGRAAGTLAIRSIVRPSIWTEYSGPAGRSQPWASVGTSSDGVAAARRSAGFYDNGNSRSARVAGTFLVWSGPSM